NAILGGRDKGPETVPAIQSADCRDKMRAQIAASSGRFALNREIPVCAGLRGGPGKTRTGNQSPRVATYQMAERTGLQSRMERQCRCHLRAAWPYLDPAPLAMPPLWGFGGDGAGCRRNRKDPKCRRAKPTPKPSLRRRRATRKSQPRVAILRRP